MSRNLNDNKELREKGLRLFGTGAEACSGPDCEQPESFGLDYLDCYFDVDAQSITVAGGANGVLLFDPNSAPWMVPVAFSMTVVDATDPQLDQRVWITAVNIHGCNQWAINNTAPTAAETRIVPSDKYDPRNRAGCACPVCWDVYSNAALTRQLSITVFNPNPAGTTARVIGNVYGKQCGAVPPDCAGGPQQGGRKKRPPVLVGGSGYTGRGTRAM